MAGGELLRRDPPLTHTLTLTVGQVVSCSSCSAVLCIRKPDVEVTPVS